MIGEVCIVLPESDRIVVDSFKGLLAQYATAKGACAIIRGLRSGVDLDYERPMASMNAFTSDMDRHVSRARRHGILGTGITTSPTRTVAETGALAEKISFCLL